MLTRLAEVAQNAHGDVRELILSLKAASPVRWSFESALTRYLRIDLAAQDWTDFEFWKELTPTNLITESLTYAVLSEVGTALDKELTGSAESYYGLIDHNDVRSLVEAFVRDATITAESLTVTADGLGSILAHDASVVVPWEGAGAVIVTNTVLATADAHIVDSSVSTTGTRPAADAEAADSETGDVVVRATNAAEIDATATSSIEA